MSALFDENNNIVSGTLNIGSGNVYDIILSDTSGNPTIFNNNNLDIDFAVSGTGVGDVLFYDVSKGRLGVNVTSPDAGLHVVSDCPSDGLKVENITNCPTGVRVLFVHNSQTPPDTGSLPVTIDLAGRDSNYSTIKYAQIISRVLDPVTSQTSGELLFTVDHTGVNREIFRSSLVNTVLGGLNNVSGHFYDVLGYSNTTSGLSYIVVGNNNDFTTNTGILVGNNIEAEGDKLLVFANSSSVSGNGNIVVGVDSTVSGLSNVALGTQVRTTGDNGIIIGNNSVVNGDNFVGLVSSANVSGQSGIGFGIGATAVGDGHVFLGSNINVSGTEDIAIGSNLNLSGNKNIVYGNLSDVSGHSIISIGRNNNPQSINSGVYIGNEISLTGSQKSMIIGLGVNTTSGLNDSVLIGINNDTSAGSPDSLVLVGQNNTVSEITESLVVGNDNNLTGTITNNIVVGPRNNVPNSSKNNLVVGLLNNTSGITISTDGSIVGTDTKTVGDNMANSTVFGINNWVSEASGSLVYGNKTRMSGLNINSVGSYTNLNGENIQNLGNSNFVLGQNNTTLGHGNDIMGDSSISLNNSSDRNQIFGSGNIVLGHNEVVVSGLSVGLDNEIYGPFNTVFGKNNTVGHARYPCRASGTDIVIVGDVSDFAGGDNVMVGIYSPASQDNSVFIGTIVDGTDATTNESLGVIKENIGSNYTTTLKLSATIESLNTIEYYVKETFDDIVHGLDPCEECFADKFAGYSSGYVIAYQNGNDETDLITNPKYGNTNIVIGNNNTHTHSSGITIGYANNISGVNHIAIGSQLSGNFNNTLQLGTNSNNRLVLDNTKIIFNTGALQSAVFFNSANPGVGSNDDRVLKIDLNTNRVGVNVTDPRSTLDVSGILTTDALRVGLSTIPGYSLHADANGNATWQLPVNLSGQNSGLIFKVDDKVGSGMNELIFNTSTRELSYLRADKDIEPNGDFILGPNSVEERILLVNRSGLYLNNPGSDHGYDFILKGSGTQDPVDGDNSVYLLKSLVNDNSIRMHNITGVSGIFKQMTVYDGLRVPLNLTGTVLKVDNEGDLVSQSFPKHSMLFSDKHFVSSGNNTLRYYADSQAMTIGTTGEPPLTADTTLIQGASNTFSNIILGSTTNVDTVFNNAGAGGNRVVIVGSGNGGSKKGFQYDVNTGALGVNVDTVDNNWKLSGASDTKYWFDCGKLVVDGKLRVNSIQLTSDGKDLPGSPSVNKYLKITDAAGNVGLDVLDLSYQFSGLFPLYVPPQASDDTDIEIGISPFANAERTSQLDAGSNGMMLIWDGSNWVHNRGFRNVQPAAGGSTDNTVGMEFGNSIDINACNNTHSFAAGSFASSSAAGFNRMKGSSQFSKHYLRTITIGNLAGNVTKEMFADYHKDATTTANANNTISLQYSQYPDSNNTEHNRSMSWHYTVDYNALFNDGTVNGFASVGGRAEGVILSYRNSDGTRKISHQPFAQTKQTTTDGAGSAFSIGADAITVDYVDSGDDANVKRLRVQAKGVAGWNGAWHAVVDVNQVHMPSGMNFINSDT
tara:strand:+ start:1639 stop:6255 length:4617 start_codon:yes stop_codon:yes gene_type:complete